MSDDRELGEREEHAEELPRWQQAEVDTVLRIAEDVERSCAHMRDVHGVDPGDPAPSWQLDANGDLHITWRRMRAGELVDSTYVVGPEGHIIDGQTPQQTFGADHWEAIGRHRGWRTRAAELGL